MDKPFILSLDLGTTGNRAIVFDRHQNIVSQFYEEFPQIFPKPGWVEHDATKIWQSTQDILRKTFEKVPARKITAIGITNQRETVLLWDKRSGKPLHNAIVWQCRRTAPFCQALKDKGMEALIHKKTGLFLDAYFSASKLRWLLDHVKGARQKADKGEVLAGTIDTWIVWNLSGGRSHITDTSNASRTMLFDLTSRSWDKKLCEIFKVPMAILPVIVPSSAQSALLDKKLFGYEIPIAGIVGDQQAAAFAQGCFEPGIIKNTYGTGLFLLESTGKKLRYSKNLLTTVAWSIGSINNTEYAVEGSVFIGGSAIQWLRDGLGLLDKAKDAEKIARKVPFNEGVYFVPALVGLGAPYWDPDARGTIIGITRGTKSAHLVRAALEAIAYQTRDILEVMKKDTKQNFKVLRVDGGASANNFLMQFQADVLGISIERPKVLETTALGAAGLAGIAVGFWKDAKAFNRSRRIDKVFHSRKKSKEMEKFYGQWKRAVERSRKWILMLILSVIISGGSAAFASSNEHVTVFLKNGNAMTGVLVSEDSKKITVDWDGSQIELSKNEISKIQRGAGQKGGVEFSATQASSGKWTYHQDIAVKLTNGQVMDAGVSAVKGDVVVLSHDLGDGARAEQDIERKRIESLEFKPVKNEESQKIEAKLREQFPKMSFYELGMVTLITDSQGSALKTLKQVIRDQESVLYFDFFDLLKTRKPLFQHYVVVFDRPQDYFEYALTDHIPAWLCPGYFSPNEKVLFMMNLFGQDVTEMIYQTVKGGRESLDRQGAAAKSMTGGAHNIEIDGLVHDANVKLENAVAYMGGVYSDISLSTLRHEFTHEFFHDWGLQTILVSEMTQKDDALIKKKKELFGTKDIGKKKELLMEIFSMKRNSDHNIQIEAANSWFVEGLAEYASTTALGDMNMMRLYELKEAKRKKELWPIEQLTVYKMGSFPGVATGAVLSAYAQSWSFVSFLMKNYRQGFLSYLARISKQAPAKDEDLSWLLQALGNKDLRTLEKEWHDSIDTLPNADDPQVEQFIHIQEILKR